MSSLTVPAEPIPTAANRLRAQRTERVSTAPARERAPRCAAVIPRGAWPLALMLGLNAVACTSSSGRSGTTSATSSSSSGEGGHGGDAATTTSASSSVGGTGGTGETTTTTSGAGPGGSAAVTSSTGSGGGCATAADCPGADSECAVRTCVSGACGITYAAAGTPLSAQILGDCVAQVCDGSGIVVVQNDPADKPVGGLCAVPACAPWLPGAPNPTIPGNAQRLETGDLNGDGLADVVLVDNGLSVLFGDGKGTFAPGIAYLATTGVQSVAVGDLNGDGLLDLAATRPGVPGSGLFVVTVLLNSGNGVFTLGGDYTADVGVYGGPTLFISGAVALGDVDGDGALDVAVTSTIVYGYGAMVPAPWSVSSSVKVLHNSGNGALTPAGSHALWSGMGTDFPPAASSFPLDVKVGDLDGDGTIDIAVANDLSGSLSVLLNAGGGTFAQPVDYPIGPTFTLAIGDLNGDGHPDIVSGAAAGVGILVNNGNGTFGPVASYPVSTPGSFLLGVVTLGDLNGDGHLDVAWAGGAVSVLLGDGSGGLGPSVGHPCVSAVAVKMVDLNGDGKLDLALPAGGGATPLLNNGNGTFPSCPVAYPVGPSPESVAIGDLDGDGKLDLAVANYAKAVSVLLGDGQGGFKAAPDLTYQPSFSGGYVVALPDLDGNGKPDLVVLSDSDIGVRLNTGNGVFAPVVSHTVHFDSSGMALGVGDLNGDGKLDLLNPNGSILINNGNGTFGAAIENGWHDRSLTLGDFDGDGDMDVATCNYNGVKIRINDGAGSFAVPVVYGMAGDGCNGLAAGDLNGDGKLDIVGSGGSVLINQGGGTFAAAVSHPWGSSWPVTGAPMLALGDLDGNGMLDAVFSNGGDVGLALQQTNGTWLGMLSYTLSPNGNGSVALGDLNGDGKLDVVATNILHDKVTVLVNGGCLP